MAEGLELQMPFLEKFKTIDTGGMPFRVECCSGVKWDEMFRCNYLLCVPGCSNGLGEESASVYYHIHLTTFLKLPPFSCVGH